MQIAMYGCMMFTVEEKKKKKLHKIFTSKQHSSPALHYYLKIKSLHTQKYNIHKWKQKYVRSHPSCFPQLSGNRFYIVLWMRRCWQHSGSCFHCCFWTASHCKMYHKRHPVRQMSNSASCVPTRANLIHFSMLLWRVYVAVECPC